MKRILLSIGVVFCGIIGFVVFQKITYSPLNKKGVQELFGGDVSFSKDCSIDFLGLSIDGSLFDYYSYDVGSIVVDVDFPKFKECTIEDECKSRKWTLTPMDSIELKNDLFGLNSSVLDEDECSKGFIEEQLFRKGFNYYSYEIIGEREAHYYVYNPSEGKMFYLRRKGW